MTTICDSDIEVETGRKLVTKDINTEFKALAIHQMGEDYVKKNVEGILMLSWLPKLVKYRKPQEHGSGKAGHGK